MSSGGSGALGRPRAIRRNVPRPSAAARRRRGRPLPRPARGPRRRPVTAGFVVAVVLAGAVMWVLWGSSLFDARSVQVIGTRELSAEEVQAVAAVPLGTPMLRLDIEEVQARVAALPRVSSVLVSRSVNGMVRIAVTERTPVAVWSAPDGVHLVDATGVDFATVPRSPPGLPELRVTRVRPGDDATIAAITVLLGLPSPLRLQVLQIGADSPADVVVQLTGERTVRWGGVESGDRKAAVLGLLLTRPGAVYDVSSPDLPTIS